MIPLILTFVSACLFAEFIGYWLHILLHSERIEFLSRNHMIHHLAIYAPNKPQRPSREYLNSTYDRANILGLGLEWALPVLVIVGATLAGMGALSVPARHQAVFIVVSLAWGYAMFWYMHDAMHLQGFWMERHPWSSAWFLKARKRHDIHHMRLSDEGRMPANFGICFFFFDRVFGTLVAEHGRFNGKGLEAAMKRYSYIFPRTPRIPPSHPPKSPNEQSEADEYQDIGVGD